MTPPKAAFAAFRSRCSLGAMLDTIYEAQLEGSIQTRSQALEVARKMASAPSGQTTMLPNLSGLVPPKE